MKILKLIDIMMQLSLFLYGILYSSFLHPGRFFAIYFMVGAGQIISFLFHLFLTNSWIHTKQRTQYGKTLLWIVIIGVVCLILAWLEFPLILFYLFALLIVSPFLAIWYFMIGIKELSLIKKRELIHLK